MITKFDNIVYPFFGLYKKPYKLNYDINKIYVTRSENSHKETADDKSLGGDYFARLLQMNNRLHFDCTCKNLQQLVFQNPKWGMDATANIFDLSKIVNLECTKRAIVKVRGNLIWFRNISYPFEIPSNEELHLTDKIYGILVKVNNEWFIKSFTFDDSAIPKGIRL